MRSSATLRTPGSCSRGRGIGLATDNVLAFLALAVVPAIGYVVRIQAEEAALERGLGEEYREYARTRARLVPGVW